MIRGSKPRKIDYEDIKQLWAESQRDMTGLTKAALARRLGLSVRTVRNVLNGYYDNRPKPAPVRQSPQSEKPQNGLLFFPFS